MFDWRVVRSSFLGIVLGFGFLAAAFAAEDRMGDAGWRNLIQDFCHFLDGSNRAVSYELQAIQSSTNQYYGLRANGDLHVRKIIFDQLPESELQYPGTMIYVGSELAYLHREQTIRTALIPRDQWFLPGVKRTFAMEDSTGKHGLVTTDTLIVQ